MKTASFNFRFMSSVFVRSLASLAIGLVLLPASGSLRAADLTWSANSYWEYSVYWSGGVRPTGSDNVFVNNPGSGSDNNLVVAPPNPVPDAGWTGMGNYSSMTINSAFTQRTNLIVYSTLIGFADSTINNRAGALVDGGTWAVLGDLTLSGSASSLTVTNNGNLSSNTASVGSGAGATSTASVTSGGRWFNDGNLSVGVNGGNGLLNIDTGGTVDLDGSIILGSGGAGSAGAVQILATGGTKGILQAYSVVKAAGAGTGTLTFDGGIFQAQRNDTNFISGFTGSDLGITSNGAYIDSNGYNIGIDSGFVGQGGLAKQGLGTLTLSGSNTYSGNTVIQQGTLEVSGSGGSINSSSATMGVGANAGENGTLLLSSGGQVTVASLAVGTASTGTGTVTVTNGTLNVSGNMSVGTSGAGSFTLSNGAATTGYGYFGSGTGTGNASVSGGTWTITNDLLYGRGTLNLTGGTISTQNNSILGAFAGNTSTATVSGGTWDTTGYLIVGYASTASLGVSGGSVVAHSGTIIGYGTGGAGTLTLSSGTLVTPFISRQNGGTGKLNLNGGTLRALSNQSSFLTGFGANDVTLGGSASIDTNGFDIGIGTALGGSGSLTKTGLGTLTLSGSNTYTGQTLVDAGTLLVNGDNSSNSRIFVDAHATLGGIGTVGDVDVGDQGVLTAGTDSSAGLLTIDGNLNMEADSILKLQIFGTGAGAFDQLAVTGLFSGTDATLSLEVDYVAQLGDSFLLFTNVKPTDGIFSLDSNLGGGLSWDTSHLSSDGTVTVVPEPGTLSLAFLGLSAIALGCRRKNRSQRS